MPRIVKCTLLLIGVIVSVAHAASLLEPLSETFGPGDAARKNMAHYHPGVRDALLNEGINPFPQRTNFGPGASASPADSQPRNVHTEATAPPKDRAAIMAQIEAFAKNVSICGAIPGMQIGIVFPDGSTETLNVGLRDTTKNLPVDDDTLFGIGSTSKAFTATLIGMLVDEGRVSFTGAVNDYLPGWRLKDTAANALVTVHDLVSHRTGLPRDDNAIFFGNQKNRQELVYSLQYLNQAAQIRTQFLYNNFMFAVAGLLAGEMSSPPMAWEDLVQQRIFDPLNMTSTFPTFNETYVKGDKNNLAIPSVRIGNDWIQTDWKNNFVIDPVGPAGSINSNARDIVKWLKMHLAKGKDASGKTLITATTLAETYKAANPLPVTPLVQKPLFPAESVLTSYGMGWVNARYRQYERIWHNGGTLGHATSMNVFPGANVGIFISCNTPADDLDTMIQYIFDVVIGETPWLNSQTACGFPCSFKPSLPQCEAAPKPTPAPTPTPAPAIDLKEFVGEYTHPTYGTMTVAQDSDGKTTVSYEVLSGSPTAYNGNTFIWVPKNSMYPQPEIQNLLKPQLAGVLTFRRNPTTGNAYEIVWARASDTVYETIFRLKGSPASPPATGCGFTPGTGPTYMPRPTYDESAGTVIKPPSEPNAPSTGTATWIVVAAAVGSACIAAVIAVLLTHHLTSKKMKGALASPVVLATDYAQLPQ